MTVAPHIEFYRNAYALVPQDSAQHVAILIHEPAKKSKTRVFCSCNKASYASCSHAEGLIAGHTELLANVRNEPLHEHYLKSPLYALLRPLVETQVVSCDRVIIERRESAQEATVFDPSQKEIAHIRSSGASIDRLLDRISKRKTGDKVSRRMLIERMAGFVMSETEKQLSNAGHKTTRQMQEESFWGRLAYHCYRDFGSEPRNVSLEFVKSRRTAVLTVNFGDDTDSMSELSLTIPDNAVAQTISAIARVSPRSLDGRLSEQKADLRFRLVCSDENSVVLEALAMVGNDQSTWYPIDPDLVHGNVVFCAKTGQLHFFNYESTKLLPQRFHHGRTIALSDFSSFLETNASAFSIEKAAAGAPEGAALDLFGATGDPNYERIIDPPFVREFARVEILPVSIDNNESIVSLAYRAGECRVPLSALLAARASKTRFLPITNDDVTKISGFTERSEAKQQPLAAVVDCCADNIRKAMLSSRSCDARGQIRMHRAALLQLRSSAVSINFAGDENLLSKIRSLLSFKPTRELESLKGLTTVLRDYQQLGVRWLLFLYDNYLGGLLCDDMGLGKTHQALALIIAIREQRAGTRPGLVVCPTTVLSHWHGIAKRFAPELRVQVYHVERNRSFREYDLILTTYGVLRNDLEHFADIDFDIAIFDEAQQIKNAGTLAYQACCHLRAQTKIGLTGTPIENSLLDIKVLFDLVMPGLFGGTDYEEEIAGKSSPEDLPENEIGLFKRLTSSFILRRTKDAVLKELPPKIEELRSCELPESQRKLYAAALQERGGPILAALYNKDTPVPFMSFFALLTHLKQLCDHPAIVAGNTEDYDVFESGKWELCKELLAESLDSGLKVVVFTQFLGMVDIFDRYLTSRNIGHAVLTGATRNRGEVVARFGSDDNCRVFVGSLKVSGSGIDLVSASVVIHYDRWWNAAREDQASDRVHRIGQKRGVQIIKLHSSDTIEERIADVIDRKRALIERSLDEDDPGLLKSFGREELMEILAGAG